MKSHMGFRLAYLDLTLLEVKLKVMHISSVNISKMVTDSANITIAIEYDVTYGRLLAYLRLILGYFRGHCLGHAH